MGATAKDPIIGGLGQRAFVGRDRFVDLFLGAHPVDVQVTDAGVEQVVRPVDSGPSGRQGAGIG